MSKVEVVIRGKLVKVEEHLLNDLAKFGVTQNRRVLVPVPKEIIQAKKIIPRVNLVPPEIKIVDIPEEIKGHADQTKGNFDPLPKADNSVKVSKPRKATPESK